MNKNVVETICGCIVIVVAVAFSVLAYREISMLSTSDGYVVKAEFDRIDGINIGSDVKVSGIKVGQVVSQHLNQLNYYAAVEIKINQDVKLPIDTSAEIIGSSLIGEKYIALTPGSEGEYITHGGRIDFTQSAPNLESLIGKFIFGNTSADSNNSAHKVQEDDTNVMIDHNQSQSEKIHIEGIHDMQTPG